MTNQAIIFRLRQVEQALVRAGIVRCVAVLAPIPRDGGLACLRPRVAAGAVPGLAGIAVGGGAPETWVMAIEAEGGVLVVLDQELAVLIVVGVMAGGALHLLGAIEPDPVDEGEVVLELGIGRGQGRVVSK